MRSIRDRDALAVPGEPGFAFYSEDRTMTPAQLVARREALGLSQSDLARALDVPRLTVWRWESGTHKMPILIEMALRGVAVTVLLDLSEADWTDLTHLSERAASVTPRRRRPPGPATRQNERVGTAKQHRLAHS